MYKALAVSVAFWLVVKYMRMRYHRQLMNAILNGQAQIAKAVNATVIDLDHAPEGYRDFDKGVARKFVLDPHGIVRKHHPERTL
ncbi:hypothetical protein C7445_101425 [Alicyclobacillus sacchari]|uniref:Zinc-binding dehydrogenase n=1 Tax=Alicyclobacillus sacchari TaxID=392010 RepID=A0A4R8LUH4_9BACL|nr:hypothetical protein C7445_101425 [Alicyclobacillus sacchari]GMA56767.1 hypothetical protein GCM10025858_12700 [Alicyclobacillus sacchari]